MATPEKIIRAREELTEQIIKDMETHGGAWIKEWANFGAAHNPTSNNVYTGRNALHLAYVMNDRGLSDPRFCTFKQAKDAGWIIRKGAKSVPLEVWKSFLIKEGETDDGDPITRKALACVSYFSVFSFEDIDGPEEYSNDVSYNPGEKDRIIDELILSSRCPVVEDNASNRACYSMTHDKITLPPRHTFVDVDYFAGTLAHEMTHSTGPALSRDMGDRFGSASYAGEELVAELGSAYIMQQLGMSVHIDTEDQHYLNHVAYLQGWISLLKYDPDAIFKAAAKAQQAADYIMDRYNTLTGENAA